ncbi:formate dehydrogenase subunit gamma [Sporichthya brevicatena]|uniref:Formate dehydrogenase subunit gamma n=1 Tax=Sporichthya brevicatena TaxID=171442 RepID=A0ABN1GTJ5_9ACTN
MTFRAPAPPRADRIRAIAAAHAAERGPLLVILHAVQAEFGFLDPDVIPVLADELNLSVAEVHGVVSFYRDFRTTPPGRSTLRICRAEACQAVGADALVEHAKQRLGVGFGETTADGAVTLDEVFCLGNCALGPSIQVDGKLQGRVSPDRLDALLGDLR